MLWYVAAVAWAAWRVWFRQESVAVCLVELGLAVVVGLVFLSAFGGARYQHPAFLIAWEWLALLLAFGLVRRLARSPHDCTGLLAAIIATGLGLAVQAGYQSAYKLRENRALAEDTEQLRQEATKMFGPLEQDDPRVEVLKERLLMDHVFATYVHPNSFAGYLALLIPVAAGWAILAVYQGGFRLSLDAPAGQANGLPRYWTLLVAACALLLALALWLTHSRGSIFGVLIVGLAVLLLLEWQRGHRKRLIVPLLVGGALLALVCLLVPAMLEKARQSLGHRGEYWTATWAMIRDHPWLGVGSGNFGRQYPRYMAPTAFEKVKEPHNFALEIWATNGLFATLALLGTFGIFFLRVGSAIRTRGPEAKEPYAPALRWDFYIGGLAGLVLGLLLQAGDLSLDGLIREAVLTVIRVVVWLAVFTLLQGIPWSGRSLTVALTAGVAALLLNLCISGGIAFSSVAQPLWVMAALALNSAQSSAAAEQDAHPTVPQTSRSGYRLLPLPLLTALALAYLVQAFLPANKCLNAMAEASSYYGDVPGFPGWRNSKLPDLEAKLQRGPAYRKLEASREAGQYLRQHILRPLEAAARADPGNSAPLLALAQWLGEQGRIASDPRRSFENGLEQARRAEQLDPDNKEAYLAGCRLHRLLGQLGGDPTKEHYRQSAQALAAAVELDPTEARLRYDLAEAWFLAGDRLQGQHQAGLALALDDQATSVGRRLTASQREQARKWLERPPANK
jgi:hypothetical protein